MQQKTIILVTSVFAMLVAGMFIFAYLQNSASDIASQNVADEPTGDINDMTDPYAYITSITAKHFFVDGVHTLAGVITMPTPCDLVETDYQVMESYPEQVAIDFTVINNSDMCTQVLTDQRFLIEVDVSEEATFSARFQGRSVDLNLIPPAEGETPADFELFIKG